MRFPILSEFRLYLCNRIISQFPSHTIRLWYYRHVMHFQIGKDSTIFMGAWFDAAGNLSMGNNSVINQNCRLDTRGGIRIGDRVIITAGVTILTADHDPRDRTLATDRLRPVILEDYAFIATAAMILPGVTLGHGSMVGAGAIVTRSIEVQTIVAGNPARPIGKRPADLCYKPIYARLFW